ncbi:YheC/D like ATP-grasp [Cohnella sp. OV330]|uniref:YheC/YheD family protein n=1 Tax=Cohnella sp. OV330 TaxID=1855288 RepID=UPI0008EC5DAA|nr:YheC/YheD family protein [Cohnella sp. OV330]SFA74351.1 YheC/D like ATP-grasp [Cohnella sp. OV330]
MGYRSISVKSKWVKTKWLLQSAAARKYVPHTKLFSRDSLRHMLSRHATVFFKPTGGTGGFQVYRIRKLKRGYRLQHNASRSYYPTLDALYAYLNRRAKGRSYLLQKGINLAKTRGRPFDIRVMVQKTNAQAWRSSALFTKIGISGKVATNYHQGGRLGKFRQTLSGAGFGSDAIRRKERELKRLGVSVGKLFDRRKRGFRELGLDVALDRSGRTWILEVNTRPQFYPLRRGDQALYRRIMSYARKYGRTK